MGSLAILLAFTRTRVFVGFSFSKHQSDVGIGATVGSGCKVGAGVHVSAGATVADSVAVFRNGLDGEQATGLAPRALEVCASESAEGVVM